MARREPLTYPIFSTFSEVSSLMTLRGMDVNAFVPSDKKLISLKQVHSAEVLVVTETTNPGIEADGMVTNDRSVLLQIITADCGAVSFYDPVNKAIGLVHAGWRGTVKGILEKTVRKMHQEFGTEAKDLVVAVGPVLAKDHYQVRQDLVREVEGVVGKSEAKQFFTQNEEGIWFDFPQLLKNQLLATGIVEENLELSDRCTACRLDDFYSYRAEGSGGRNISSMWLTK